MTELDLRNRSAALAAVLQRWSRGQALTQLTLLFGCAWLHAAWPIAPGALASFAVLSWLARGNHTPSGRFGWANAVTTIRLVLLLTLTIRASALSPLAALAVVCGVLGLDLVDGWLARACGDASSFGAHFDMESDAQLVLVLTLRLWLVEGIGAWVLFAGLLRYLYVLGLWLWPESPREAPRSVFARYAFALLMVGLCGGLVLPRRFATTSAWCGTVIVSWSFARSSYFSWRAS